jgi:hypothetical protein
LAPLHHHAYARRLSCKIKLLLYLQWNCLFWILNLNLAWEIFSFLGSLCHWRDFLKPPVSDPLSLLGKWESPSQTTDEGNSRKQQFHCFGPCVFVSL